MNSGSPIWITLAGARRVARHLSNMIPFPAAARPATHCSISGVKKPSSVGAVEGNISCPTTLIMRWLIYYEMVAAGMFLEQFLLPHLKFSPLCLSLGLLSNALVCRAAGLQLCSGSCLPPSTESAVEEKKNA